MRALRRRPATAAPLSARRRPFDPEELESRLVWVFSHGESSSLVERLCRPLELDGASPTGFGLRRPAPGALDALPVPQFLVTSHLAPALGEPVEAEGSLYPATLNNYLGHKSPYLFAKGYEEVWRPPLRRLVLARLHATLARAQAGGLRLSPAPLLIVEEADGAHAADLVMSLFPRSRLLLIVRHGPEVVTLRMRRQGSGAPDGSSSRAADEGERLERVRRAARHWACEVDAMQRAYEAHRPELRHMVHHEELLGDSPAALERLLEWLGLERGHDRAEGLRSDLGGSPGGLSDAEREAARGVMGTRPARLGYEA